MTTYLGILFLSVMILALLVAARRHGPVSSPERMAAQELPSVISAIGMRIPIEPIRQWFATAMGRRFSRKLSGLLGGLVVASAIAMLNGTEIGMKQGISLIVYPAIAYFWAKAA